MSNKNNIESVEIARWRQLRNNLCWRSPVLAPGLAALQFRVVGANTPINTAAIDAFGRVYIFAPWSTKQTDAEVRWVILHECLHQILRHHDRVQGRDPKRWNIAADLLINEVINNLRIGDTKQPEGALSRAVHTPGLPSSCNTVEEIYEWLRDKVMPDGSGSGEAGDGCGVAEVDPNAAEDPSALSPSGWRNLAQATANAARAGSEGGAALAPLLHLPPSRVRWSALMRELAATSVSRAGRDQVTWSRRSRRSPAGLFLPGTRNNVVRLAVVIDSSGSMSDEAVSVCVAEAHAAVLAAGISAFLVVHDHVVRTQQWISPTSAPQAIADLVTGRGGTLFAGAYEAVAAQRVPFAAIAHFTDGWPCEPWPDRPANCARAICALTPDGREAAVPGGWRIVPIAMPGVV